METTRSRAALTAFVAIGMMLVVAVGVLIAQPAGAFAANDLTAGSAALSPQATITHSSATKNLDAAQKMYSVTDARTIVAKTPAAIEKALATAKGKATSSKRWIVYAPKGTYKMSKKLVVPANVVFVAETASVFTPTTSNNFTQFFMVNGSLYGGTYKGSGKSYYCLRFANVKFSGKNGHIDKTVCSGSQKAGIIAIGGNTTNAYVNGNTVSNCGTSGISAAEGAWIYTVSNNKVSGCGQSGVNLGHANINNITGNTLTGNKGHGISTDINGGSYHAYCYMKRVENNKISSNGVNGVYVDKKCKISVSFKGNTITGSKLNGLSIEAGAKVCAIMGNTIKGSGASNISVVGKNASLQIGASNSMLSAGTNNLSIDSSAVVELVGGGNAFNSAKNVGISMNGGSLLKWTKGTKNQVKNNGGFGIRVDGKSTCNIQYITFSGNGGFAMKVYKGSKFSQSNTNLRARAGAANRLYVE